MTEDQLEQAWVAYRGNSDSAAKNEIVLHHMYLVERVAKRMAAGLPSSVELDDLMAEGTFGLMEVVDRYDESLGSRFETFAMIRIKGAILDYLRRVDWVPRALRTRSKQVENAMIELEIALRRKPTIEEIARHCELTTEEVEEATSLVLGVSRVTLDATVNALGELEHVNLYDTIGDNEGEIEDNYEATEFMAVLANHMKRLSSRERVVMVLYYCEAMTLQSIGDLLGVTESRACQIHNRALSELRSMCVDLS